jgi:hypothetical protein
MFVSGMSNDRRADSMTLGSNISFILTARAPATDAMFSVGDFTRTRVNIPLKLASLTSFPAAPSVIQSAHF